MRLRYLEGSERSEVCEGSVGSEGSDRCEGLRCLWVCSSKGSEGSLELEGFEGA